MSGKVASGCNASDERALNLEKIKGRVAVFLFSSAGELDVVLPMLKINHIDDYKVLVFKSGAKDKIDSDSFYRTVTANRLVDRSIKHSTNKAIRWLQFFGNAFKVAITFRSWDLFCFEYGGAGREKNILVLLLMLLGRGSQILFHPHGHAVTDDTAYSKEKQPRIVRVASAFGARILKINGVAPNHKFAALKYPILHPVWREYVARKAPALFENHVVILSRDVHPAYLLEENRLKMFQDVVGVVAKCLPSSTIVVKAHPREKIDSELMDQLPASALVTYENTYAVIRGARLAISFWTSAFFQCMALGVPVVEYHIAHAEFRARYPKGSLNSHFIPCFSKQDELEAYVKSLA